MDELPEFRVTLTRLKEGETAYPQGPDVSHYEYQGQRSKFGGKPDNIQGESPPPNCPDCRKPMTFVAQIDSVEHDWKSNPHAVSAFDDCKWMFGDVGMIYVFYCFGCLHPEATTEMY